MPAVEQKRKGGGQTVGDTSDSGRTALLARRWPTEQAAARGRSDQTTRSQQGGPRARQGEVRRTGSRDGSPATQQKTTSVGLARTTAGAAKARRSSGAAETALPEYCARKSSPADSQPARPARIATTHPQPSGSSATARQRFPAGARVDTCWAALRTGPVRQPRTTQHNHNMCGARLIDSDYSGSGRNDKSVHYHKMRTDRNGHGCPAGQQDRHRDGWPAGHPDHGPLGNRLADGRCVGASNRHGGARGA
jgi:hypothetical protein